MPSNFRDVAEPPCAKPPTLFPSGDKTSRHKMSSDKVSGDKTAGDKTSRYPWHQAFFYPVPVRGVGLSALRYKVWVDMTFTDPTDFHENHMCYVVRRADHENQGPKFRKLTVSELRFFKYYT